LTNIKQRGWLLAILLLALTINLSSATKSLVLCNDDNIVNPRAIKEIEKIGNELKAKSDISIFLCVKKDINNQKIKSFEKNLLKGYKKPYILLTLSKAEKKVDIATSSDVKKYIDIDEVLSPFSGTIIPILTERKGKDKYSAAMLNGYADIADRVAKALGIKLKSSIGNTNRILINILRVIIYGSFLYFVVFYIKRKYFTKKKR